MEYTTEELALIESVPEDGLEEMAHEQTIGSKGKGLWGMKGAQLPAYIQHVYNDLVESGKHKPGSMTYRLAVGIVQKWARGGGNVKPDTKAKAVAAIAEWDKLRAKAKADNVKESAGEVGRISEAWSEASRAAALAARRRKGKKPGDFSYLDKEHDTKDGIIGGPVKASKEAGDHYKFALGWAKTLKPGREIGAGGVADHVMIHHGEDGKFHVHDREGKDWSNIDEYNKKTRVSTHDTVEEAAHAAAERVFKRRRAKT